MEENKTRDLPSGDSSTRARAQLYYRSTCRKWRRAWDPISARMADYSCCAHSLCGECLHCTLQYGKSCFQTINIEANTAMLLLGVNVLFAREILASSPECRSNCSHLSPYLITSTLAAFRLNGINGSWLPQDRIVFC